MIDTEFTECRTLEHHQSAVSAVRWDAENFFKHRIEVYGIRSRADTPEHIAVLNSARLEQLERLGPRGSEQVESWCHTQIKDASNSKFSAQPLELRCSVNVGRKYGIQLRPRKERQ